MWKLWPLALRTRRALLRHLVQQSESIQRLEIAGRRQQLAIDALGEDVQRLSDRLCAAQGRVGGKLGGRPRKGTLSNGALPIESIPHGDKAALRAHFRLHPPKESDE